MPPDVMLREASPADAPAIAELLNAHADALFGERELDVEEVRHWFTLPNVWIRVAERDGRLAGYVDVADDHEDGTRFNVDARTLEAGAADLLLAAAEEHARGEAVDGTLLRGYAPSVDEVLARAYERAGYRTIRHSFQMRTELPPEPPAPEWPDGISVRTLGPDDDDRAYEAQMEAFADHWDFRRGTKEEWRRWNRDRPDFDPSLWFLAEDRREIAGVSFCAWHFSGDPQFGWVHVLGVRPPWRRRGLGLALLRHSFAEFARRGATRVGLGVDAESTTGAVSLYERAGMRVARRSDTWEKPL